MLLSEFYSLDLLLCEGGLPWCVLPFGFLHSGIKNKSAIQSRRQRAGNLVLICLVAKPLRRSEIGVDFAFSGLNVQHFNMFVCWLVSF